MKITRHGLLPAVLLVGIGAPALIGFAMNRQMQRRRSAETAPSFAFVSAASVPSASVVPTLENGHTVSQPRSELWRTVSPDIFAGPAHTPPVSLALVALPAKTPPVGSPLIALAKDPLADYVYTGTVMVNGETEALIEQRKSKQGWYVNEGDLWQGYHILAVDERQVVIEVGGERRALAKSDAFNAIPLTADAAQTAPTTVSAANTSLGLAYVNAVNATTSTVVTRDISAAQNSISNVLSTFIRSDDGNAGMVYTLSASQ